MKRATLLPVGLALAGLFARGGAAAPTTSPLNVDPRRDTTTSGNHLLQRLVALPRSLASARLPSAHYSHSSHASHVSHASHASHFSSSSPPPPVAPPPPPPTASTGSSTKVSKLGYARESDIERALKQHGINYRGRHVAVSTAICVGESQYGVRVANSGLEYHRFSCSLFDTKLNSYAVQIVITKSNASYFWWRVLSVKTG